MNFNSICSCCLALVLATGCATSAVELKPSHPYGKGMETGRYAWHHLRFKWHWPQGVGPDWSLDPLAADLILSDIISRHQETLPLWRFHRRAGRGPAGHQFSFLYYTTPETARLVSDAVAEHAATRGLMEQGLLEKVSVTRPERPSELLATSDPNWPKPVQSTWPMFIMGVSQAWLGLVEVHAGNTTGLDRDLEKALTRYDKVNDKVNEIWAQYGQHAYFHHISGVFGYQPMRIRKRMRF